MLKLKVHSEVGIGALQILAQTKGDTPIRSQDLAERLNTSRGLVEQVMTRLTRNKLAGRRKGPKGGYLHIPGRVTVGDVMKAMDDPVLATTTQDTNSALGSFYTRVLNATTETVVKE
jgi:DNA-binding IscR family transcriptional regulator